MRCFISALAAGLLQLAHSNGAAAQTPRQNPFRQAEKQLLDGKGNLNYVAPLRTLLAGKAQFDPNAYGQALATYYSFVGQISPAPRSTSSRPGTYQLADPMPLIAARAKISRVVILNEDHTQPGHRAFCQELLPVLAPLGYHHFAVEALDPADKAINTRNYPLSSSGYYTREPTMGRLLRAARATGFEVFGHEITRGQEKEFTDWRQQSNYRDSMQAVNILAVMKKNPAAKIVVYVGHDHVLEREREGLKHMAAYLRKLGHFDPLTIDQTTPYYHAGPAPTTPRLLTTNGQVPTTTGFNAQLVDLQVIHPPHVTPGNRPAWLATAAAGKLIKVPIPSPYAGTQCLAQLYDQGEYQRHGDQAIPLDQYFSAANQKQVRLYALFPKQRVVVKYRPANLRLAVDRLSH